MHENHWPSFILHRPVPSHLLLPDEPCPLKELTSPPHTHTKAVIKLGEKNLQYTSLWETLQIQAMAAS